MNASLGCRRKSCLAIIGKCWISVISRRIAKEAFLAVGRMMLLMLSVG